MATERVVLKGAEAMLAETALQELQAAQNQATAVFARRLQPIRTAHGIAEGARVTFGMEGEQAIMAIEKPDPPKRDPLAVVPPRVRGGKKH